MVKYKVNLAIFGAITDDDTCSVRLTSHNISFLS